MNKDKSIDNLLNQIGSLEYYYKIEHTNIALDAKVKIGRESLLDPNYTDGYYFK